MVDSASRGSVGGSIALSPVHETKEHEASGVVWYGVEQNAVECVCTAPWG